MEDAAPLFYPPPSPDPSYLPALGKKKKNQGERSSKLSGQPASQPASQSAPCTLAVSSGLDIEEGSAAAAAASAAPLCICICVWVCARKA